MRDSSVRIRVWLVEYSTVRIRVVEFAPFASERP